MVKPIVRRSLQLARALFVIVMIIGALGVPVCKLSDSIEPMRAYSAYRENPLDATRHAMEEAYARDSRRRATCMSASAMIVVIAAAGFIGVTVALRAPTI
jgi:hypothetical protein